MESKVEEKVEEKVGEKMQGEIESKVEGGVEGESPIIDDLQEDSTFIQHPVKPFWARVSADFPVVGHHARATHCLQEAFEAPDGCYVRSVLAGPGFHQTWESGFVPGVTVRDLALRPSGVARAELALAGFFEPVATRDPNT